MMETFAVAVVVAVPVLWLGWLAADRFGLLRWAVSRWRRLTRRSRWRDRPDGHTAGDCALCDWQATFHGTCAHHGHEVDYPHARCPRCGAVGVQDTRTTSDGYAFHTMRWDRSA